MYSFLTINLGTPSPFPHSKNSVVIYLKTQNN